LLRLQIRTNFDDMIGKNAGNCLFNQRKYFDKIMEARRLDDKSKAAAMKSKIPLKFDDNDGCDVLSVLEMKVEQKTVKQQHRAEALNRMFAQRYMQSAWKDFEFINKLKANKTLLESKQNAKSFDVINREIDECVESCDTLMVRRPFPAGLAVTEAQSTAPS
jgi:hypothetical protein